MTLHFAVLLAATLIDRLVGDPEALWRRVPHPVVLMGRLIALADRHLNRETWADARRRAAGIAAIALLLALSALAGWALHRVLALTGPLAGGAAEALLVSVFLAHESLRTHVAAVAGALRAGGLPAGRNAVSQIVGRDPEQLDGAGVCRAAIESCAENASDGIVAPWLWFLAFGLPGLLAYKMLNTADSMIGHLSPRHRAFGFGAAKLDDLANWIPARLTAALFALAAATRIARVAGRGAWRAALRDGPHHRSPNAGWPESAVAGALGLALGGPRRYGALAVEAPMLNAAGRRTATPADIDAALGLLAALGNMLLALGSVLLALSLL